jgi:hypothetical protein
MMVTATWFENAEEALRAEGPKQRELLTRNRFWREAEYTGGGWEPVRAEVEPDGVGSLRVMEEFRAYFLPLLNPWFYRDSVFQSLAPEGMWMEVEDAGESSRDSEQGKDTLRSIPKQQFLIMSGNDGLKVVRMPVAGLGPDTPVEVGLPTRIDSECSGMREVWRIPVRVLVRGVADVRE